MDIMWGRGDAYGASDLYERTASELILKDAQNADVRRFAQTMVADHGKTAAQVSAAAGASQIAVAPRMTPRQQAMIDELRAAPVGQREKLYMTQQVAAHREALALHQNFATRGDKAELKKVAAEALPVVRTHLAEAERLGSMQ